MPVMDSEEQSNYILQFSPQANSVLWKDGCSRSAAFQVKFEIPIGVSPCFLTAHEHSGHQRSASQDSLAFREPEKLKGEKN